MDAVDQILARSGVAQKPQGDPVDAILSKHSANEDPDMGEVYTPQTLEPAAKAMAEMPGKVIEGYEKYAAAPFRAGVYSLTRGKPVIPAVKEAFGHPEKAPEPIDVIPGGDSLSSQSNLSPEQTKALEDSSFSNPYAGAGFIGAASNRQLGNVAAGLLPGVDPAATLGAGVGLLSKAKGLLPKSAEIPKEPPMPPPGGGGPGGPPEIPPPASGGPPKDLPGSGLEAPYRPEYNRIQEIAKNNPDLNDILAPVHKEMYKNEAQLDTAKRLMDTYPEEPHIQAFKYENNKMKADLVKEIDDKISSMAGGEVSENSAEAGAKIKESVLQVIKDQKKQAAKLFDGMDKVTLPQKKIIPELQSHLIQDVPEFGGMVAFDEEGKMVLKPHDIGEALTEPEHRALSKVVDRLNKDKLTFKNMQNMREQLRKMVDPENPEATRVLNKVRASMGDFMDSLMDQYSKGKVDYRSARNAWRQSEAAEDMAEGALGGRLEPGVGQKGITDEDVLRRIFTKSDKAQQIQQIVGPEKFREFVGEFLNDVRRKSSAKSSTRLSSSSFSNALSNKDSVLSRVMEPKELQRIKDVSDLQKYVADLPTGNPSGSGKHTTGFLKNFVENAKEGGLSVPGQVKGAYKTWKQHGAGVAEQELIESIFGRGEFPRSSVATPAAAADLLRKPARKP